MPHRWAYGIEVVEADAKYTPGVKHLDKSKLVAAILLQLAVLDPCHTRCYIY
jgi:hypothetical protein